MPRLTPRERLLRSQKSLAEQVRQEIEGAVDTPPSAFTAYSARYHEAFAERSSPCDFDDLFGQLESARLAYFGDYHTLREARKAPLRILQEMSRRGRQLVLATEVIHVVHQDYLDQYQNEELSEPEFLELTEYHQRWGFSWRNYKLQFEYARDHEIPMFALNSDPGLTPDTLQIRDAVAALVLDDLLHRFPDALIVVIFGDLHIAPEHLPRQVEQLQGRRSKTPLKSVFVYQNVEKIYWDLADRGLEQQTPIVRVDGRSFCLLNSTPLVKYQSYLNGELNQEELEESRGLDVLPSVSSNFMTEQVYEQVQRIVEFLELPQGNYDDFSVHTLRDLDFIDRLSQRGDFSEEELEEIRHHIEGDESYFIPKGNIIYLGNLSIEHAAEEATHYLNIKLSGHTAVLPDRPFDFYYRIVRECIGFFGSRIINHARTCHSRADYEEILLDLRGRRLPEAGEMVREISKGVIKHLDYEDRWLLGSARGYPRFKTLYQQPTPIHIGITHGLGYILGNRMYDALMAGRIRRNEVRQLFRQSFDEQHPPREFYFDWVDYLRSS